MTSHKLQKYRINAARGRTNAKSGKNSENLVLNKLKSIGLLFVQKINTPFCPVRRAGKIVGGYFESHVPGDFTAMTNQCISVFVESKKRSGEKLSLKDFKPHQLSALNNHNLLGGVSLVTWVTKENTIYVMRWPIKGLEHRKPLSEEQAIYLHRQTIEQLHQAEGKPYVLE